MKLVKSSSSILRKFLVFNFLIFLVLGLFTFFYLKEVQPGLVKQKSETYEAFQAFGKVHKSLGHS